MGFLRTDRIQLGCVPVDQDQSGFRFGQPAGDLRTNSGTGSRNQGDFLFPARHVICHEGTLYLAAGSGFGRHWSWLRARRGDRRMRDWHGPTSRVRELIHVRDQVTGELRKCRD